MAPVPARLNILAAFGLLLLGLLLVPPAHGQNPGQRIEPERPAADNAGDTGADMAGDAVAGDAVGATATAPPFATEAPVRLNDRVVFSLRVPHGTTTAEQRARAAGAALERLSDAGETPVFRYEAKPDVAVVYGDAAPILQLYPEDAAAVGDSSLAVHAASVTDKIADAFRSERRRKAITSTIFSLSLLVFSGLIALFLLRKATDYIDRARRWVRDNPHRLPALRVLSFELVRPAAVRTGFRVALTLVRILTQVGIVYGWVLLALSLFDATRGYGARLTGYVFAPIGALVGRIGSAIPIVLVATLALVAVLILLRFVRVFFASVAGGETSLALVPPDVAVATGVLVRVGIILIVLLLASPLITGSEDGSLSRAGLAALVAIGVACAPVLACAAAGIPTVYGRRLQPGDYVELGQRLGRVKSVDLLEVKLEDELGCELRVPHLLSLFQPTRILGRTPVATVNVCVDASSRQGEVRAALLERARRFGPTAAVALERLDARGAHYRITAPVSPSGGDDLAVAVADVLRERGVRLT
jgi:small-conductance mechanosensitive channel